MAKTCRDCKYLSYTPVCQYMGEPMPCGAENAVYDCKTKEPRETPLLVDVLAKALEAMLTLPYQLLHCSSQQAARIDMIEANAKAAVSRYKEEVGDAEV